MKKLIYSIIIPLGIMNLLGSCFKDDTRENSLTIPKITLVGDDVLSGGAKRVAYVGEETTFSCEVIWNGENEADFDYKWTFNGEVVSTEATWTSTFTETGSYSVAFEVIERATGLSVGTSLSISVSSKYLIGWLILSEKDGESSLSFITDKPDLILYPDIYKTLWPNDPLGAQPYRLEQKPKMNYDEILVMQHGGDGLVELDGRTFRKVILTKDEFVGEVYPYENFNPVIFLSAWSSLPYGPEYLVTEKGEVYSRIDKNTGLFNLQQFPSTPLSFPGGAEISYLTFPKTTYHQLMYDKLNRKWRVVYKSSNQDEIMPDIVKDYDDKDPRYAGIYDFCSGLPEYMELIYAQTCDEWGYDHFLVNILKNKTTGQYIFQKATMHMDGSKKLLHVQDIEQYEFAPGLEINDETQFWMERGQNKYFQDDPLIFFNVGNKLYFHLWSTGRNYLFKDFSIGTDTPVGKIVCMHTNSICTQLGIAFSDGHYYICDVDPTDVILKICRGDIDPLNLDVNKELELAHFKGLGKIVHSIFKCGRWNNWSSAEDSYR